MADIKFDAHALLDGHNAYYGDAEILSGMYSDMMSDIQNGNVDPKPYEDMDSSNVGEKLAQYYLDRCKSRVSGMSWDGDNVVHYSFGDDMGIPELTGMFDSIAVLGRAGLLDRMASQPDMRELFGVKDGDIGAVAETGFNVLGNLIDRAYNLAPGRYNSNWNDFAASYVHDDYFAALCDEFGFGYEDNFPYKDSLQYHMRDHDLAASAVSNFTDAWNALTDDRVLDVLSFTASESGPHKMVFEAGVGDRAAYEENLRKMDECIRDGNYRDATRMLHSEMIYLDVASRACDLRTVSYISGAYGWKVPDDRVSLDEGMKGYAERLSKAIGACLDGSCEHVLNRDDRKLVMTGYGNEDFDPETVSADDLSEMMKERPDKVLGITNRLNTLFVTEVDAVNYDRSRLRIVEPLAHVKNEELEAKFESIADGIPAADESFEMPF